MSTKFLIFCTVGIASLALSITLAAQHHPDTHRHPAAAKLKNPVAGNAASIASGRELYKRHCAECHGATGKGDGHEGQGLEETPANFTDAKWEHGTTDGEMFVVIRDGAGKEMKPFAKKLTERQIWDVVTFVRTLGPKKHS